MFDWQVQLNDRCGKRINILTTSCRAGSNWWAECRLYWYQCSYEFCSSVRLFINSVIDPWSTFFLEKWGLCKFWAWKQNNSKTVCNSRTRASLPWVGQVYNIQPHKTILSSINGRKREAWTYSNKLESFPTSYHISWCYIDFLCLWHLHRHRGREAVVVLH